MSGRETCTHERWDQMASLTAGHCPTCLLEENERLRAQVDTLTDVIERMGTAAEARIDAALAKAEPSLRSREGWGVVREMVEALKGKP